MEMMFSGLELEVFLDYDLACRFNVIQVQSFQHNYLMIYMKNGEIWK